MPGHRHGRITELSSPAAILHPGGRQRLATWPGWPEKGLHVLVDAFIYLHRTLKLATARLHIAGWLGKQHEEYVQREFRKLNEAGLQDKFTYLGEVDRHGKIEFLKSIDVLSVPTTYREPKGLSCLSRWPPAFPWCSQRARVPELLERTGGGRIVAAERSDCPG